MAFFCLFIGGAEKKPSGADARDRGFSNAYLGDDPGGIHL